MQIAGFHIVDPGTRMRSLAGLDGWKSSFSTIVIFALTLFLDAQFVGIVEEAETRFKKCFGCRR